MPYSDPEEQRQAQQRHYRKHKPEYLRRSADAKIEKRKWVQEQKNVPCMDCKKRYPYYVMHFDHREDTGKLGNVGRFTAYRWAMLIAEVAKCDVVCANCHAERTHQRGYYTPPL